MRRKKKGQLQKWNSMVMKINAAQIGLGLSVLGGLAVPGAASASTDVDTFMVHYEGLQRSLCGQDADLAVRHMQRLVTPNTLPAYRYYNPVIVMTPRCPNVGLAVSISPRGQVRPETMDAFYRPPVETAPVESAPVESNSTRQRHHQAQARPIPVQPLPARSLSSVHVVQVGSTPIALTAPPAISALPTPAQATLAIAPPEPIAVASHALAPEPPVVAHE